MSSSSGSGGRALSEDSFVHLDEEIQLAAASSTMTPTTNGSGALLQVPSQSSDGSSSAAQQQQNGSTRLLTLHAGKRIFVRIPVSAAPYQAWISADALRDDFLRTASTALDEDAAEVAEAAAPEGDEEEDEQNSSSSAEKKREAALKKERAAQVVLTARFLRFVADKIRRDSAAASASTSTSTSTSSGASRHDVAVLSSAWAYFNTTFLGLAPNGSIEESQAQAQQVRGRSESVLSTFSTASSLPAGAGEGAASTTSVQQQAGVAEQDVHALVAQLIDTERRPLVLRAYFEAFALLEKVGAGVQLAVPALLRGAGSSAARNGPYHVYAIFGGQGGNEVSLLVGLVLPPDAFCDTCSRSSSPPC